MEDVTQAYDVAQHAARVAWRRLGSPAWSAADWDDITQDAVLAVVRVRPQARALFPADPDRQRAYVFGAARQAAVNGYLCGLVAHNPASTLPLDVLEYTEAEAPDDAPEAGLPDAAKRELEAIFLASRKQRRGRVVAASKRDALICDLIARGYRNQGLATALGISVDSVKAYRRRIKQVLAAEAERRGLAAEAVLKARRRSYDFVSYRVRRAAQRATPAA